MACGWLAPVARGALKVPAGFSAGERFRGFPARDFGALEGTLATGRSALAELLLLLAGALSVTPPSAPGCATTALLKLSRWTFRASPTAALKSSNRRTAGDFLVSPEIKNHEQRLKARLKC